MPPRADAADAPDLGAPDSGAANPDGVDGERAAAARVLSHEAYVRIGRREAQGSSTWTVTVADPEAAEGLPAPAALEGAKSRGATLRYRELRLPPGLAPGTSLTFKGPLPTTVDPFAPSGRFQTVAGLPTTRAELVVRTQGAPLSLWTSPGGRPEWTSGRRNEIKITWRDLGPHERAEAVWTGATSWFEAGDQLIEQVEAQLTDAPGRELERDLAGMTPARATQAVFQAIRMVPGPDRGWIGRSASQVIASGAGTRAERGFVLMSLLRTAGYEPIPALYQPSSSHGSIPAGMAVPSLLRRPILAVPIDGDVLWIDPGADWAQIPGLPAELIDAIAWIPGDLPRRIRPAGGTDGSASISGEIRLDRVGGGTFTLTLTARDAAEQHLREQLSLLDDESRDAWLGDLLTVGHPDVERVSITVHGLRTREEPLAVTLHGYLPSHVDPISDGLYASSGRALLAPALARMLPPRIAVHEELSIAPPPGLHLLAVAQDAPHTLPSAVVAHRARSEADRVQVVTDVERPYRNLPDPLQIQSLDALAEAARIGPELLHLADATPAVGRQLRSADLPAADRVSLEAMILWRAARYGRARKLLDRFLAPIGLASLDRALVRYNAPYELRRALVDRAESDADLLATVPILRAMDRRDEAWERAAAVALSRVHALRVGSRLHMVALQPEAPPDPEVDPEGAERWRDPMELLHEADASVERLDDPEGKAQIQAAKARIFLEQGQIDAAVALLQRAVEASTDPEIAILLAAASARADMPVDRVVESLNQAIAGGSADAEVYGEVSDALAQAGATQKALDHALTAARLAARDDRAWRRVTERAMAAGELHTALFAARKASDLALSDTEAATALTFTATLAGDTEQATIGWSRGGTPLDVSAEPTAAELIGLVEADHLLAVLRHHDSEVVADPGLLSLRAELELAAGARDRAVRDGTLLLERHDIARGGLVAFAAGLGEVWSSDGAAPLDRIVDRDPAARAARVELRAVLGGRLIDDLRRMGDDPRSTIWRQALDDPEALAASDPTFDPARPPRDTPPRGFTPNPVLGAVKNVRAWSSPLAEQAVVRHASSEILPPPLSLLYTPERPALRALPNEGRLYLLTGGALPLYAAVRVEDGEHILGLGHSPQAAARALAAVPPP